MINVIKIIGLTKNNKHRVSNCRGMPMDIIAPIGCSQTG